MANTRGAKSYPRRRKKKPHTPEMIRTHISTELLLTAYTPIRHNIATIGIKIFSGVHKTETKMPNRGKFKTSSKTLPIYMLATKTQKMSG